VAQSGVTVESSSAPLAYGGRCTSSSRAIGLAGLGLFGSTSAPCARRFEPWPVASESASTILLTWAPTCTCSFALGAASPFKGSCGHLRESSLAK
jgi:hypothetical protein